MGYSLCFSENMTYSKIKDGYHKSIEYEKLNKYSEAITSLKEVYVKNPYAYTVNYRLGWLYYLNKNYENSLKHLGLALKVNPSSVEVQNILVILHVARYDWEKAENNAVSVIKLDFYNQMANYWYSYSLKKQKKYDLAIKVDIKMLTLFPISIMFLSELGENYYLSGEKEKGLGLLKEVLILSPNNTVAKYYIK